MKALKTIAVAFTGLCAFFAMSAFAPENSGNDKKQVVVQLNARPVATRCVTAAGVPFAVQTTCVANPGTVCAPTQCPGVLIGINRKPVVVNCIRAGQIIAFANTCAPQAGAICAPTACP